MWYASCDPVLQIVIGSVVLAAAAALLVLGGWIFKKVGLDDRLGPATLLFVLALMCLALVGLVLYVAYVFLEILWAAEGFRIWVYITIGWHTIYYLVGTPIAYRLFPGGLVVFDFPFIQPPLGPWRPFENWTTLVEWFALAFISAVVVGCGIAMLAVLALGASEIGKGVCLLVARIAGG